ncbi:flavin reductase (DIM6/NTAB) family NADH-FMN oxidoreductase RutF [Actinocorallia herbida]|uniref:Flavin reductase (DIM6/NTAB) family NADH-FMN oxidoreductase RutF n=1 Tax=Actinocorallia herbida TaxID=58109 RepID=A0A3N1CPL9_9ACTN|nr:flavin reductase family protein [Actinocorallia herbida]ROO83267.1 flavin reductase (DIM6/NTAB) family NADH-FMN oxidoreductase RutF [Actinocorallia herbida]
MIAPQDFTSALASFATGVTVVTVSEGRDDIGATVSSFASVSLDPPMLLIGVSAESYLCEVLHRRPGWAVTVLSTAQRALAGRFAAEGRPSARLLLGGQPHHRGRRSEALIIEEGVAALECETRLRIPAGDHVLFVAEVTNVDYITREDPLIRVNRRYR